MNYDWDAVDGKWSLIEVDIEPGWTQDDSNVYVTVHRVVTTETHKQYAGERVRVRVDLMALGEGSLPPTHVPLRSWIGSADAVRKAVAKHLDQYFVTISHEHAAYIGAEITKAALMPGYRQS